MRAILPLLFLPLFLSSAQAAPTIPSNHTTTLTPPTALLLQPTSPIPPKWSCTIKAWVRAPDLSPNLLVSSADARLKANGTDCDDIVKWEVGLRFKERGVVRLAAKGVTLPLEPQWNETEMSAWLPTQNNDYNDIYNVGFNHWNREENKSPYDLARENYDKALRNRSLWEVHGAECKVFDSRVELASVEDGTFELESIKSFQVIVPNVNIPPRSADGSEYWYGGEQSEFSNVETALHYYFALSLRNGSTLEFAAGRASFLPSPSYERSATPATETVTILVERPAEDNWNYRVEQRGNCTVDNTTRFEIDVQVPSGDHVFEQGQQLNLPTTIRRLTNTTQKPTYITFLPQTYASRDWASSFAHTPSQRLILSGVSSSESMRWRPDGDGVSLWQFARKALDKNEREKREREEEEREMKTGRSCELFGNGREMKFGTVLDGELDVQSVLVNFTIPYNMMPTFKGTFKSYLSYLTVTLHTTQSCDDNSQASKLEQEEDEEEEWQPHFLHHRYRSNKRKTTPYKLYHLGNTSIIIDVNSTRPAAPSTTPLSSRPSPSPSATHYLTPSAQAPYLLPLHSLPLPSSSAPMMNQLIVEETDEKDLKQSRYRMSGMRYDDGGEMFVGDLWNWMVQRSGERREERERKGMGGFVVQG